MTDWILWVFIFVVAFALGILATPIAMYYYFDEKDDDDDL